MLLIGLAAYWPLQVIAIIATRGQQRWVALTILAMGLLVTAFAADPVAPTASFSALTWTASATLADVILVALVVTSWLRPMDQAGGSAQVKAPPAAVKRNVASPF
jgi:hypothetical protein